MKVYRSVDEIPSIKNPVVTLGTYDGVHLGHQEIISFLKKNAKRTGRNGSVHFSSAPENGIIPRRPWHEAYPVN